MKRKAQKEANTKKVNFEELIFKNISQPKMALDYSGYQFTYLDLSNKSLQALSPIFKDYKCIQTIDLSGNLLTDLTALSGINNLVTLKADKNNIKDMKFLNVEEGWKNLRNLNLSNNKIVELISITGANNLRDLNLCDNKIQKTQSFTGHPKLKILDLRRNKLVGLQGIGNMPELQALYLAENKIKNLGVIQGCSNLKILHLRKNCIVNFEEQFPLLQNLTYLNLRENLIQKLDEIFKTKELPNLKTIIFSHNPLITKFQYYLFDTINNNLKLTRINKIPISKNLKLRAFQHAEDKWRTEEEAKRLRQEEQRRKQQEAEAAQQAQQQS